MKYIIDKAINTGKSLWSVVPNVPEFPHVIGIDGKEVKERKIQVVPRLICEQCKKEYKNVTYFAKHVAKCDGTIKLHGQHKQQHRQTIPKAVRITVWEMYIGKDKAIGKCLCCKREEIKQSHFECGHIKSVKNGGATSVDNLRPICSLCNKSMGSKNMNEFRKHFT